MRRFGRSLVSVLSVLCLLVGLMCPAYAAADYYPDKEHPAVAYSDMEAKELDDEYLFYVLNEMEELIASGADEYTENFSYEDSEPRIRELYGEITELYYDIYTQNTLWNLRYYSNPMDEQAQMQMTAYQLGMAEIGDAISLTLKSAAGTVFEGLMEELIGSHGWEQLLDYDAMTDRQRELNAMENELVQEYGVKSLENYTVVIDGEEWDMERLYSEGSDNYDFFLTVLEALYKAKADALNPILIEMIAVRNELAEIRGYDSYADLAYEITYSRDYTAEDLTEVYAAVKKYITPLMAELYSLMIMQDNDALQSFVDGKTAAQMIAEVEPYIKAVDPELGEAFDGLKELGLYDMDAGDTKIEVGFTSELPAYGSAFIFNCPVGNFYDYVTLIHEFGHFNNIWHNTENLMWSSQCYDVAEIQSQALTLLFLKYSDELFGDGGSAYTLNLLYQILSGVVDGCVYDEFQNRIYEEENLTADDLNRIFYEVGSEYGYNYAEGKTEAYSWVDVAHTFESPFYYISYATSALASLEIWANAQTDWDAAVDSYMKISAMNTIDFSDALSEAGLKNVLDAQTIESIADTVSEAVSVYDDGLVPAGAESMTEPEAAIMEELMAIGQNPDRFANALRALLIAVAVLIAAVFVLKLLLALILLAVRNARYRKKNRKDAEHAK